MQGDFTVNISYSADRFLEKNEEMKPNVPSEKISTKLQLHNAENVQIKFIYGTI